MQPEAATSKPRDENDRLVVGTLPENPGDDATVIPISSKARSTAMQLAPVGEDPLPTDRNAEMGVLACLMWAAQYDPHGPYKPTLIADLLEKPAKVSTSMMSTPAHHFIWEAMTALSERGAPCDTVSVHSELARGRREKRAGGIEYLEQLVAAAAPPNEVNLREYAGSIREAWMRRVMIEGMGRLASRMRTEGGFASDIALDFASKLADFASKGARDASYVHISAALKRTVGKAQNPTNSLAIKTGFAKLDHHLIGGWKRKKVTVLAARTSVGKSALALEFAITIAKQDPNEGILYVSLEMEAEDFTDRMVASRAKVEARSIISGVCTDEETSRIAKVHAEMAEQEIFFNAKQDMSIAQIRSIATKVARELVAKGKRLAMIIIDHVGLVKSGSRKHSREQEVAEVSRGLRVLADDFDCHVMALAQISREAEKQTGKDKMPQLMHLRESGALEQDPDNVLIIHRPRDPKTMKFVEGVPARLGVAKARGGEVGMVWLACEPKYVKFSTWETSDQAKARAPDPNRNPSRQYVPDANEKFDDDPEPPPGRFEADNYNPLTDGL